MAMQDNPRLIDIEQVCDGWVKKYIVTYELADGSIKHYDVASRKDLAAYRALLEAHGAGTAPDDADAVSIVATTPDDTVVMIREFRYPLNSWCIAFPAGLKEPGERPEECAARELEEETGFSMTNPDEVRVLRQAGYSSTGLTDETVQIVFVQAEKTGQPHTEPGELIEVFELPFSEIRQFLDTNTLPIGIRAQLILELLVQRG